MVPGWFAGSMPGHCIRNPGDKKKKLERLNFVIRYEEPVLRDGNEKRGGN